jgi:hypothetical protein
MTFATKKATTFPRNCLKTFCSDEEGHIDFLETQLQLLETIGEERYGLLNASLGGFRRIGGWSEGPERGASGQIRSQSGRRLRRSVALRPMRLAPERDDVISGNLKRTKLWATGPEHKERLNRIPALFRRYCHGQLLLFARLKPQIQKRIEPGIHRRIIEQAALNMGSRRVCAPGCFRRSAPFTVQR